MKLYPLTAASLRVILTASIFAIAALGITLFSITSKQLSVVATEISHTAADANASQNNLQGLQSIQKELDKRKSVIERTASIVAESQSYLYQDQIITELNTYASQAGISITNIDFGVTATATPTAPAGTTQVTPEAAAPSGVKLSTVSITLKNPVDYVGLLRFIKSIEQNLTKMQVANISLSKSDGTQNSISSDMLNIEVYIR